MGMCATTTYENSIGTGGADDVMSKLKFIGRLKKGEKIDTVYNCVQDPSLWSRARRALSGSDSRNSGLLFIKNIIDRSFELIRMYKNSEKKQDQYNMRQIVKDLSSAMVGILNFRETYSDDSMFVCRTEVLIQSIHARMQDLDILLDENISESS